MEHQYVRCTCNVVRVNSVRILIDGDTLDWYGYTLCGSKAERVCCVVWCSIVYVPVEGIATAKALTLEWHFGYPRFSLRAEWNGLTYVRYVHNVSSTSTSVSRLET